MLAALTEEIPVSLRCSSGEMPRKSLREDAAFVYAADSVSAAA
jgi:hypothetical protein